MIAVIFEVWPEKGRENAYLDIAAGLRQELEALEGFISIERFRSLNDDGKILSMSFFENEEALQRWRNLPNHRNAQASGRAGLFADYRLRIASVIRDYGLNEREQAPEDSRKTHG